MWGWLHEKSCSTDDYKGLVVTTNGLNFNNTKMVYQIKTFLRSRFLCSALCGDNLPGDGSGVPWDHQRDDVPYGESCAANRGIPHVGDMWVQFVLSECYLTSREKMHQMTADTTESTLMFSAVCISADAASSPGRDYSQHLQQRRQPGPHPADGAGLYCVS